MNKKYFKSTILILLSFVCGYYTSTLFPIQEQKVNVFGTYVNSFSTISIHHNSTYQFTYPFTEGQIKKIDEKTYKLENGNLNGFIIIFSNNTLKLIDTKNCTTTEFNRNTYSESELKENY